MSRVMKLLQVLTSHEQMGAEGPKHVRVFAGETFLFASYDHGRERLMDIRAHSSDSLKRYYYDWLLHAAAKAQVARTPVDPAIERSEKDTNPEMPSLLGALRKATRR